MTLFGTDGSDFTNVMDFSGLSFVTHKATEHAPEQVYEHVKFARVMQQARNQGVPFLGAYVVPRTGVDPRTQAETAINFVRREAGWLFDHPGFFWQDDLEKWPYDDVDPEIGKELMDWLEQLTPKAAINYASHGQYGNSIPNDGRPLWNANYNNSGSGTYREQYDNAGGDNNPAWAEYSGRVPLILQYSSDSTFADGNPGDANAFRGTEDDFRRLIVNRLGTAPSPVPSPTPTPGGNPVTSYPPLRVLDGVELDSVGRKVMEVYRRVLPPELLAKLYVTSNVRRGDPGYHGAGFPGNSLPGNTGAADIAGPMTDEGQAAMRDAAEAMMAYVPYWIEYIHTTPYSTDNGYYVKNGVRVGENYYGAQTNADHVNHNHNASSDPLMDELLSKLPNPNDQAPAPTPEPTPVPVPTPTPEPTPVPPQNDYTAVLMGLQAMINKFEVLKDQVAMLDSKVDSLTYRLNSIFK